jgi:hypothetical protein
MMATIATQPLIVAKVGLQSKPPPARDGKPFKSFSEVMQYIVQHEGLFGLFKGIGPQILKGLLVQGFLMMTKERYSYAHPISGILLKISIRIEFMFVLLFRYMRQLRAEKLQKLAEIAAEKANRARPIVAK